MRAGRMRHVVDIERPVETQNALGEVVTTWVAHRQSARASIEPIAGREFFAASQVQSAVSTRIRVRFDPALNEKMRVKHIADTASGLAVYYDIDAVITLNEKRHETHLMCTKRAAEGRRGQ